MPEVGPTTNNESSIFISYAQPDRAFVERLNSDLQAQGLKTWMDRENLAGGQYWEEIVVQEIDRCEIMLVVVSPDALDSKWVKRECRVADDNNKTIIPLVHRQVDQGPLKLRLAGIQQIDFEHSYLEGLKDLLLSLARLVPVAASSSGVSTVLVAPSTASQESKASDPVATVPRQSLPNANSDGSQKASRKPQPKVYQTLPTKQARETERKKRWMYRGATTFLIMVGQWVLIVVAILAATQAIQSYLQAIIAPEAICSAHQNPIAQLLTPITQFNATCTDVPLPGDATLTMLLSLGGLAIYVNWFWPRHVRSFTINNLDAVFGGALAGIVLVLASATGLRFVLDIVTRHPAAVFPQSLLTMPPSADISSYRFLGFLLASLALLLAYFQREKRWEQEKGDSNGLRYGIVTLAVPFALAFFTGASAVLANIFLALFHKSVTSDDWNFGLTLLIPGLIGGAVLWRDLRAIGRGGLRVTLPGRAYVYLFLVGTEGAMVVSLIIGFYALLSGMFWTPLDPTGYLAPRAFAITLITFLFAHYYSNMRSHW